ncbi:MAG: hypothetical protein HYV63_22945 [Candidatus Schekmanbacteria bacterium]|nr:hypothetical protein [Candidatus Schekmanbacteria bacterium]
MEPAADHAGNRCAECNSYLKKKVPASVIVACDTCGATVAFPPAVPAVKSLGKQGHALQSFGEIPIGQVADVPFAAMKARLAGVADFGLMPLGGAEVPAQLAWIVAHDEHFLALCTGVTVRLLRIVGKASAGSDATTPDASGTDVTVTVKAFGGELPWPLVPGQAVILRNPAASGELRLRLADRGPWFAAAEEQRCRMDELRDMFSSVLDARLHRRGAQPAADAGSSEPLSDRRPYGIPAVSGSGRTSVVKVGELSHVMIYFGILELVTLPFVYPERHELAFAQVGIGLLSGFLTGFAIWLRRVNAFGGMITGAVVFMALAGLFSFLVSHTGYYRDFSRIMLVFLTFAGLKGALGGLLSGHSREGTDLS